MGQASAVMKASPRTVRLHLEHIFEQTNLHRQQDLIRALLTLPAGFSRIRSS